MQNGVCMESICSDMCHRFQAGFNRLSVGGRILFGKDNHGRVASLSVEALNHHANALLVQSTSTRLFSALTSEKGIVDLYVTSQQRTLKAIVHRDSQFVHEIPNRRVVHVEQASCARSRNSSLVLGH